LGDGKPFRTRARAVLPFSETREVDAKTEETQPTAKVKFLKMATTDMLEAAKAKLNSQSQQVSALAASTTAATSEYIAKSSSRLKAFQEKCSVLNKLTLSQSQRSKNLCLITMNQRKYCYYISM